jgi:hypothetical protein
LWLKRVFAFYNPCEALMEMPRVISGFVVDTLSKPSGAPAYPTPALRQNAKERGTHCVGNARKIKGRATRPMIKSLPPAKSN